MFSYQKNNKNFRSPFNEILLFVLSYQSHRKRFSFAVFQLPKSINNDFVQILQGAISNPKKKGDYNKCFGIFFCSLNGEKVTNE